MPEQSAEQVFTGQARFTERLPECWPEIACGNGRCGSRADITRLLSNVRSTPQSGQSADMLACPLCATSGLMQCSKTRSFDNIISARKQCRRQFEAERLGGLEVDEQLNFCGLLDGQIGQLLIL